MQRSTLQLLANTLQRHRQTASSYCNLTASCQFFSSKAYPNVLGATILERLPVIAPPDPAWEVEYAMWKATLDDEYRKEYPPELCEVKPSVETEEAPHDFFLDIAEVEDAENPDPRSPWRRLNQRIFFLVKLKGKENAWEFPFKQHQEGEFCRDTAMRALREVIEPAPKIFYVGNSPAGHYRIAGEQTLFFHRAQLIKGNVLLKDNPLYSDYAWVGKDELWQYVKDQKLRHLLSAML